MQKISIVIIAKNDEKFISKVLDKIALQDYNYFEVVIADRCSTDNTLGITRSYPVKIVRLDSSCNGLGEAINFGIANTIGEIIFVLSGNTVPVSNKYVSTGVKAFETKDVFLSFGEIIDEGRKPIFNIFHKTFDTFRGRGIIAPQQIKKIDLHSFAVRKSDWLNKPIPENNIRNYWQWIAEKMRSGKKIFFEPKLQVKNIGNNKVNIFSKTGVSKKFKNFYQEELNDLLD